MEECHITRQAFYYHFEDIPDLIHWVLYQEVDVILEECMAEQDIERGIRHFFSLAAQLQPYAIRGIQSSYGDEIGRLLEQFFYDLFQKVVDLQTGMRDIPKKTDSLSCIIIARLLWDCFGNGQNRIRRISIT